MASYKIKNRNKGAAGCSLFFPSYANFRTRNLSKIAVISKQKQYKITNVKFTYKKITFLARKLCINQIK